MCAMLLRRTSLIIVRFARASISADPTVAHATAAVVASLVALRVREAELVEYAAPESAKDTSISHAFASSTSPPAVAVPVSDFHSNISASPSDAYWRCAFAPYHATIDTRQFGGQRVTDDVNNLGGLVTGCRVLRVVAVCVRQVASVVISTARPVRHEAESMAPSSSLSETPTHDLDFSAYHMPDTLYCHLGAKTTSNSHADGAEPTSKHSTADHIRNVTVSAASCISALLSCATQHIQHDALAMQSIERIENAATDVDGNISEFAFAFVQLCDLVFDSFSYEATAINIPAEFICTVTLTVTQVCFGNLF